MAGSRTLKLSILADIDDLKKNLGAGAKEVETFGSKLGDFGKKAAAAFAIAAAAAVAYAGKLAIDGVKSAIEDEKAQALLAGTLRNVTKATNNQIAAVESYITKTSLATGITDEQLRPSLDRLLRSTESVSEAQRLQSLALDISAGTGKSLQTVTEALGKAYDGNFVALNKLGGSIDASIIKNKDFDAAIASLSSTFEGKATAAAETFDGKLARLKVAFDETKETVGSVILDALTPLLNNLVNKIIPAVSTFIDSIGGKQGISSALKQFVDIAKTLFTPIIEGLQIAFDKVKKTLVENQDELKALFNFLKTYLVPFLGGALKIAIIGIANAFDVVVDSISAVISGIQKVISLGKTIGGGIANLFGGARAAGGPVANGSTYLVGEKGPELFTPSRSGYIVPNNKLGGGQTFNITVNGAIDPVATAIQIQNILTNEANRAGNWVGGLGTSRFAN
jgi:hypothetical protein